MVDGLAKLKAFSLPSSQRQRKILVFLCDLCDSSEAGGDFSLT
jgi:hypothetical protein